MSHEGTIPNTLFDYGYHSYHSRMELTIVNNGMVRMGIVGSNGHRVSVGTTCINRFADGRVKNGWIRLLIAEIIALNGRHRMRSATLIVPGKDGTHFHLDIDRIIASGRAARSSRGVYYVDSNVLLFGHIHRLAKLPGSFLCDCCLITSRVIRLEVGRNIAKAVMLGIAV